MDLTQYVLVFTAVLLITYDVYAYVKLGGDETISWKLYGWSRSQPIIPFLLGVLMGHIFWVQNCS